MMGEAAIAFYVVGALVTVYIVAETWRSRDVRDRVSVRGRPSKLPLDRRIVHWWRARQRFEKTL